ncbi:hypothetical protein AB8879_07060 [Alphaproteobacteria bacterium LSUCC0744]
MHLLIDDKADMKDKSPTLLEAVEMYLQLKANKDSPTFVRAAKRNSRYVVEALGNRPITAYASSDAAAFRDHLFAKGLSLGSVKRIFGSVRSIINLVILEHGIEGNNACVRLWRSGDVADVVNRTSGQTSTGINFAAAATGSIRLI